VSGKPTNPLLSSIRRLANGETLASEEVTEAFRLVMAGEATPAQISALLVGLRVKGETPAEVAGVARAMRQAMVPLDAEDPESLVDTCGTGGGTVTTFNISTAAALLAAGAGVRVAKHGNRSFTSLCGSADVLEALGVAIEVPVAVMAAALREAGLVFMFAPLMHPAMRHVGPVRRELGVATVMNIVGPLANPAHAGRQVIGVADERRVPLIAGALKELGTRHTLVVHGAPGLDELSPLGETRVVEIREADIEEWSIHPRRYGLSATVEDLAGGSPHENAAIIINILSNDSSNGARAAVLLNAAAAIYVAGLSQSFDEAMERAREALEQGQGLVALARLRTAFGSGAAKA
jgi:anthranilate phosphoribosyltransferase